MTLATGQNTLGKDEVVARLASYPKGHDEVTKLLYEFGNALVSECEDRGDKLDGKATFLLGYGAIILAFLTSQAPTWTKEMAFTPKCLVLVSAIAAVVAVGAAFWGARSREWRWYSDKEWLREGALADPEALRRYYVLVMHEVRTHNGRCNVRKASAVVIAQNALAVAAATMAAAVVATLANQWF